MQLMFKAVAIEIWQHWTEVGDWNIKKLESISFFVVNPAGRFWLNNFAFSLVLAGMQDFILHFPQISLKALATWSGLVYLCVLPFSRSLTDGY